MNKLITTCHLMLGCAAVAVSAGAAEAQFLNDIKIPMRDGVSLAGDIYLPKNRAGAVGCLLTFSPYKATAADKPTCADRAEEWGVACMAVDCRGLCHSEGVFDAFDPQLVNDADDLLKWIAAQPWSNGKVVMTGGSYPGNTQLAAMKSGNPALVACAPSVITFDPYSINFQHGVLIPQFFKKWHCSLAGEASWNRLAEHSTRDSWWAERCDLRRLAQSRGRAFYQAGWFDMLGIDTFESFKKMPAGSVLRIGPWSHGVNTYDKPEIDYSKLGGSVTEDDEIEFLRSALAGQSSESRKWPGSILMYVMGRNEWRYEREWPLKRTVYRDYDFTHGETRSFSHDPKNPVPMKGGRIIHAGGQYDQREIEKRADVLSYTGEALAEDLEVTGNVVAKLKVSSTAATSDVTVKLVDVYPDGRAMNVLEGICRASYKLGDVRQLEFLVDITSYVFLKGHRIRVDVAGSCAPHFEVNPTPAKVTIHPGSALVLPTIPSKDGSVLFSENFRNYADNAPNVAADNGMVVANDPIWRRAAELNVRPVKEGTVFVRPIALPADGRWDFLFNVKFLNSSDENPGRIALRFEGGSELVLTAGDFGGLKLPHAIPAGAWTECAIKATDGKAELYVAPDREYVRLGTVPLKGKSVNFAVASNKCFAVTDLVLRKPAALPAHPVENLFADFRSLAKPLANAKTASGGEKVALKTDATEKLRFSLGATNATAKIAFTWSDGRKDAWEIKVCKQDFQLRQANFGLDKKAKHPLADSLISIGPDKLYVRPQMRNWCSSYDMEQPGVDVLREWNRLPAASRHVVDLELVKGADGKTRLYLDGSFVRVVAGRKGETPQGFVFEPGKGVRYALARTDREKALPSKFVRLDLSENPRAKAFFDAKVNAKPPKGVPFKVAEGRDSADVAICHEGKGNWALEVEEYLGRSPEWGFPSAVHFRVPAAPYGRVHLLFALDDDEKKDKILTVRFGHYKTNGTGGNTLGDVRLDFSNGMPKGCVKAGTVVRDGKTFDLWYLAVETNLGPIVDLAARRSYLDFEFFGRPFESFQQIDNSMKPHPDFSSAVNVFACTLERASALMDMVERAPGNVFTADERDRTTAVAVIAQESDAKGSLSWTAKDVAGKTVFEGRKGFSLAKAGQTNLVEISLNDAKAKGYYTLDLTLDAGGAVTRHEAAFAVLPEAGRNWKREDCPWGTWWFQYSHGAPGDFPTCGPQLQKAGIRKTTAKIKKGKEAESYSYDVTTCGNLMAPSMREFDVATGKFKPSKVTDRKTKKVTEYDGEQTFVNKVKAQMETTPNADHILIWHESGPHCTRFPDELTGLTPDPAEHAKDVEFAAYVNEIGRIVRKHFPQLKIQIGNNSAALGAATRPLRGGANPDYYDVLGIETPSQVIVPERVIECGFLGFLATQEAASKLCKRKVPVNGTWEFIYRCERDMGEQQQAEWYARDAIIALSHGFFLIDIGLLHDCNLGYYNGLWGGSGLIRRAPYVYPKRAYVAYANVTKVLDDVKFTRAFDTGSTTVYANEFKRADGKFVTVLWNARGQTDFTVVSESSFLGMGGGGTVTEMYGETHGLPGGEAVVRGGTSPVYLVTDKPLKSVTAGKRTWPKESRILAAARTYPTGHAWLESDPDMENKVMKFLPILKPGAFSLARQADGLAVTLDRSVEQPSHYVTEYTTVRFAKPVPLEGEPSVIGIKVDGNSNWGQLRFEIEDADGEVFKNLSTGSSWGCDIMDWPGNLAVNFDGPGAVYTAVRDNTLMNDRSPGPVSDQWVSDGGDKKIRYPIKVRAVTVGMNRWASTLFGFEPLKNPTIVLGDLFAAE